MSGFETGAIQSIRNNQNLRRGPGLKFKESMYHRGCLPAASSHGKVSKLIKRADDQRNAAIKRQLLCIVVVALIASAVVGWLLM